MKSLLTIIFEKEQSDKLAVISRNDSLTYRELCSRIRKTAHVLKENGIRKQDKILISAVSSCEYIVQLFAVQYLSAVTIPVERAVKTETLEYLSQKTGAAAFITAGRKKMTFLKTLLSSEIAAASISAEEYDTDMTYTPEDIAEFVLTSGTTGFPKSACHTNFNIYANTLNTCQGIGIQENDVILIPLPLHHSFGLRVLRAVFFCGASAVLQNGTLFPKEIEKNITQYSCTGLAYISTAMESVLNTEGEAFVKSVFGKLRFIEFSAGAVPVNIRQKLITLLPGTTIHNTWGSSETGGCMFLDITHHPDKISALGKAGDFITAGIYLEQQNTISVLSGKENAGRLALKGDMVMQGYWNDTQKNQEAFKDGWLLTNDLVWKDEEDYFYMIGRADDMINIAGEKIAPQEIETIAVQSGYLQDCACFMLEDASSPLGAKIVLLAVGDKTGKEQLSAYLKEKLDRHKIPQEIQYTAWIPRNNMGKIDRKQLKSLWNIPEQKISDMLNNPVIQTIMSRRSIRNFTEKQVPEEIVKILVEAGRYAPSGRNTQTRRFTVMQSSSEINRLKHTAEQVAEREKTSFHGFFNPPLMILVSNERRNKDGIQDSACAVENILLAAASLGLGGVWLNPLMNISDQPEIRKLLNEYHIPNGHIVWAAVALGYPDDTPVPNIQKENIVYYVN